MNEKQTDSLFDSDENGQQILPFDFPEDDVATEVVEATTKSEVESPATQEPEPKPVVAENDSEKTQEEEKTDNTPVTSEPKSQPLKSDLDSDTETAKSEFPPLPDDKPADKPENKPKEPTKPSLGKTSEKIDAKSPKKGSPSKVADKKPTIHRMPKAKKKGDLKKMPKKLSGITSPPSHVLREARVRAGLSAEQVSQTTKIKCAFIEALENDDEANFPSKVFVAAYIKQLCKLYKVDPQPVLNGFEKKMDSTKKHNKVPDEILQDIDSGKQINMQEEERLKKIFKIAMLIIGAVVVVAMIGKLAFNNNKTQVAKKTAVVAENADTKNQPDLNASQRQIVSLKPKDLEVFMINQPTFTMTKLKVPNNDE